MGQGHEHSSLILKHFLKGIISISLDLLMARDSHVSLPVTEAREGSAHISGDIQQLLFSLVLLSEHSEVSMPQRPP